MLDAYADPPVGAGPPITVTDTPPVHSPGGDTMRPDVTKVQIIALVQAVLALAAAFGLHISQDQRDAIIELAGQLGVALIIADAGLRGMRNLSDRSRINP